MSGAKLIRITILPFILRILFLVALPLAVFSSGSAASLEGKVMEVVDGEDIAVLSQGHLVKVKLIAVAAPDKNQSFAGISRQHLAAGRQYVMDAGLATGTVRILSKQIGDERELFFLCELNAVGTEASGPDFLNSFKIR